VFAHSGENMKFFLLEISDRAIKGAKIVHPFFPTKSIHNNCSYDFQKRQILFLLNLFFLVQNFASMQHFFFWTGTRFTEFCDIKLSHYNISIQIIR